MCAIFHPNRTTLSIRGLARKKVLKVKSTNFTRCSTYSASQQKILSRVELKKMKFCMCLVNYFHYVCAKFHPKPTTFSVKGLTRKKVVKPKSTNFTRCSTYSASNDKISGQKKLRKLKLCMYLIIYFHYVSAKSHPNPTFLRVKWLARQEVVKPKIPNFTRCSTYSASDDKISSQGELKKIKLCV